MSVAPAFQAERCVRYRYRYSECRRCADVCPHDAIAPNDEGVQLDAVRCQNCGLCTSACRTAALADSGLDRVELLKRAIAHDRFSIACAPSGRAADARVPCLGALDAAMLAYLAMRGIDVELRGTEHCRWCPHGRTGRPQLDGNLEGCERLEDGARSSTWRRPRLAAADASKGPVPFRAGRRQLFRRLAARAVEPAAAVDEREPDTLPLDKAIRPGKWFLPEMRELLQIVCRRGDGARYPCQPHAALPLMDLKMDAGCNACEACFRACPTGALQVRESDVEWRLAFQIDRCIACGVCLEVCKPGVLQPLDEFDPAPGRPPDALHRLSKQRCRRCDRFFVSPEPRENCAVCSQDEDCFAEIFG